MIRIASEEVDGEVSDCVSELPGLIDEAIAQAKAGTIALIMFDAVLPFDLDRNDAALRVKLEALVAAVEANTTLDEAIRSRVEGIRETWALVSDTDDD